MQHQLGVRWLSPSPSPGGEPRRPEEPTRVLALERGGRVVALLRISNDGGATRRLHLEPSPDIPVDVAAYMLVSALLAELAGTICVRFELAAPSRGLIQALQVLGFQVERGPSAHVAALQLT